MKKKEKDSVLVLEEQEILDNLVDRMDKVIDDLGDKAKQYVEEAKAAREAGIHENYYAFLLAKNGLKDTEENRKKLMQARDELYDQRVEVYIDDDKEATSIQMGDTSFGRPGEIFVTSKNRPICRAFWGGQMPETYEFDNIDENGKFIEHVKCRLKLGRNIDLHFSKVRNVISAFPLTDEEQEELIVDILTQELLERRNDNEWKSILKSIQNKQKEIVLSPLKENIIVQGCAGSGKTMIMLHRLPIILMDNPNVLRKNNIYVITPSKTYIQLARDMIRKYDIADVSMGILKDYYDYCIGKYTYKGEGYGEINPSITLSKRELDYVYSKKCLEDIKEFYETIYSSANIDLSKEFGILGIQRTERKGNTIAAKIQSLLLDLNHVIIENDKVLKFAYKQIRDMVKTYQSFAVFLSSRQSEIVREIRKKISKAETEITKAEKELLKLDQELNERAWNHRQEIISNSNAEIESLTMIMRSVEDNTAYFEQYIPIIAKVEELSNLYEKIEGEARSHINVVYSLISGMEEMKRICDGLEYDFYRTEEKYIEYGEDPLRRYQIAKKTISEIEANNYSYIDEERSIYINQLYTEFNKKVETIVFDAYFSVLQKLGVEKDDKGEFKALTCSPYLFLQTLYLYSGAPNDAKESLITIDEVQGVAPEEIQLIKNINGDKLILNLFGDVRQHIEGTKGIDSWHDLDQIMKYTLYELRENYRNAIQITEYCNDCFADMNMRPMNTAGKGVHIIRDENHLINKMTQQFVDVNRTGLAAIIVKNVFEADYVKSVFSAFEGKLFDMTGDEFSAHRTRWNIITVDEAKGLEFSTVVVLSGNMTSNEKYIAYTRALDELTVFDTPIDTHVYEERRRLEELRRQEELENQKKQNNRKSDVPKNIEEKMVEKSQNADKKYVDSAVKKFFEEKGYEVIDNRSQKGHLWVIGEKTVIQDIVNQAVKEFKIMGQYKASKETNSRKGWCTKTKK